MPVPVDVRNYDALTAELESFLAAVSGKGEPAVSGSEGLSALTAAEAILEKSEQSIQHLK